MNFKKINYILFDAANTLIHKPLLWENIQDVLKKYGHQLSDEKLKFHHKLVSDIISFPDKTSKEFYNYFNAELLISFGIIPSDQILNDLFSACSYLPWEKFNDCEWLNECSLQLGILSNFNENLTEIVQRLFGDIFNNIIISSILSARKPDLIFFEKALNLIGIPAKEILYIGDSFKLDFIPAKKLGFNVILIDRLKIFPCSYEIIHSLSDIKL